MYILFRGTDSKSTKKKSKKPFREQYGNLSVLRSFYSGKYFFYFHFDLFSKNSVAKN